ncbi:MAG: IPExxxVDY family protein [Chitinophagaceae bacterium]|nr:IPExxxVDY family protein [Chitinophagaceae bacterium]
MKLKIDNQSLIEGFFVDTRLLGIVAPLKDYRFCWYLNQILRFDFRKNNTLEIQLNKKNRNYFFSIFEYAEKSGTIHHYLYNNQFDGEFLLPEFKHLDFLWLIKDDVMENEEVSVLMNSIRGIPAVQLITELTNEKIKNKQHLIF